MVLVKSLIIIKADTPISPFIIQPARTFYHTAHSQFPIILNQLNQFATTRPT